eukprot:1189209-Prorocentrum_minimum.AAC.3
MYGALNNMRIFARSLYTVCVIVFEYDQILWCLEGKFQSRWNVSTLKTGWALLRTTEKCPTDKA